jgi:hypothetical protein
MSSSLFFRSTLAVCVLLCVGLATATVVQTSRVSQLRAQLQETQSLLDNVNHTRPHGGSATATDAALRQLLNDKEAAYATLKDQYDELQHSVAQASEHTADSPRAETAGSNPTRGQAGVAGRRGQGGAAWLEQIRKEDPERYQQIVAQREQRRQQAEQDFQEQLAALDQRAQAAATPTEAELSTQIADTLVKLNDLREQMRAARNLPEDDPQRQPQLDQLGQEMRPLVQQLGQLREQDRTFQLQGLAKDLGLEGDKVQQLVDSVPQIYRNTQYRGQGGPGGGFFGGPPGGQGQPPQTQPQQQSSR